MKKWLIDIRERWHLHRSMEQAIRDVRKNSGTRVVVVCTVVASICHITQKADGIDFRTAERAMGHGLNVRGWDTSTVRAILVKISERLPEMLRRGEMSSL